jgi:3-hydroxymyristoyl/3-hydroxydecanoyl-(acyl carrier protein) dehydratase
MTNEEIISNCSKPFLFVDEIKKSNENRWKVTLLDENLDFYKGHFEHHPVTRCYLNRDNGSDRISLSWYIYIR